MCENFGAIALLTGKLADWSADKILLNLEILNNYLCSRINLLHLTKIIDIICTYSKVCFRNV